MRMIRTSRLLLLALVLGLVPMLAMAPAASAGFGVAITIAPPALPVYAQPVCPGDGYIWTPGYWAYGDAGYFWVPGTWVLPPRVGVLWTPGYWGWGGGGYFWHAGYWGPHVGFYGGINYGFGYFGVGFQGGYWNGGHFFYNRAVNNVNVTNIHNVYNRTVVNDRTDVNRVSFNGGRGGIGARPSAAEMAANRDQHIAATGMQRQQEHFASTNRAQLASVNHGQPAVAASARPGEFSGRGAVAANGATRNSNSTITSHNIERNTQRDNSFARSQNHSQGNISRGQQSNTNRSLATRSNGNSTHVQQNNARQFDSRSSNSTNSRPSNSSRSFNTQQRNNTTRQQTGPAYRQNTSRPAAAPPQNRTASRSESHSNAAPRQSTPSHSNNNNSRGSSGGSHASNGGGSRGGEGNSNHGQH
ncbi:MAG: hypothetical protein WCA91_04955 [Candidatus Acidiferrales bacterium]